MKYDDYRKMVEDHLLDFLPEVDNKSETIYEAMSYSVKAGGKRLRPVLVLAACDFAGGNISEALPYALALEYIHTYSLIHDDLPCVDNDDLRRGVPTNHKVFGEAMATLAGDGLLNSAFEAMLSDMMLDFDREDILKRKVRAAGVIAKAAGCRGMIAGQVADIEAEGKKCSGEMLDYIHANKTGAIIRAAVMAGAYLGGADSRTLSALSEYAENIGLAFQICDDILDVTGTTEELGKNVGHDEETEKSTYPALYGLEYSEKKFRELNERALDVLHALEAEDDTKDIQFFEELVHKLAKRRK